jgi:3-methyladenine DNA glycosylase AlkC
LAKKLKDYYDEECVGIYTEKLSPVYPDFDPQSFRAFILQRLEVDLPFSARQDLFAEALHQHLRGDYPQDLKIFAQILGPPLAEETGMFTEGWWLWPVGRYMERCGGDFPQETLAFLPEFTSRHTGEFAIRPLLMQDPRGTMTVMRDWSLSENVHVRRLASEGLRIALPWGKKTEAALEAWDLYQEILGNLKADPSKFVQKSVGNNLNDLMKVQPEKAWHIIHQWEAEGPAKETQWIIKHGKRSLK